MRVIALTIIMVLFSIANAIAAKRELLLFQEFPLVTVASKKEQRVDASPMSISVIDEKEIRLSGARNIPELLRRVVGVDVLSISSTDYNVSFRGFNQEGEGKVLVMVDGRTMYLDFYGIVLWDALPISMVEIKQIELVRGPGSSMYGGNAFNGVINIITKSPGDMEGTTISLAAGGDDLFTGDLIYAGIDEGRELGYKIAVSRDELDEWGSGNAQRYSTSGNFLVEKSLYSGARLKFSGSIDESEGETLNALDNFTRETTQSHLMLDYTGEDETRLRLFWNSLDTTVTGKSVLPALKLAGLVNEHQYEIETDTYEAELTKLFETEKAGNLLAGINYSINRLDSLMMRGSHNQKLYGVFVEDEYRLSSKWTATIGGRYDHHPLVDGNFSPRLGLVYSMNDDHHFRVSRTTAYGLPTFVHSYLYVERGGPFATPIEGNRNLKVEKIKSWDVGYTGIFGGRLKASADIFYNEIENIIRWPENTLPIALGGDNTYRNRDNFDSLGAELDLKLDMGAGWELALNYAYLHIDYSDGERFRESPDSKVDAGINYLSESLYGSLFAHYVSSTRWPRTGNYATASFYNYSEHVGGYTSVSANIGLKLRPGLELSLSGTNIFKDGHREFSMGDPIGRRFIAKMTSRF